MSIGRKKHFGDFSKNKPKSGQLLVQWQKFSSHFLLFFRVKFFSFQEEIKACKYYKKKPLFAFCNLAFFLYYLFRNPYVISKRFLQNLKKEDLYSYGETPYSTLEKLASSFSIQASDTVLELGSGRGKALFWLTFFVGCKTIGIEWIPIFVKRANHLASLFGQKKILLQNRDFFTQKMPKASFVYLYGTCLSELEIQKLLAKFKGLAKSTKIITISFPLIDYSPKYQTLQKVRVIFPWGKTFAYLNQKN